MVSPGNGNSAGSVGGRKPCNSYRGVTRDGWRSDGGWPKLELCGHEPRPRRNMFQDLHTEAAGWWQVFGLAGAVRFRGASYRPLLPGLTLEPVRNFAAFVPVYRCGAVPDFPPDSLFAPACRRTNSRLEYNAPPGGKSNAFTRPPESVCRSPRRAAPGGSRGLAGPGRGPSSPRGRAACSWPAVPLRTSSRAPLLRCRRG